MRGALRRPRSFKERRQAKPKREPYDLVLIVCEGAKTEPDYFRALISELRLSTANVEVIGEECGSSPNTLVEYAIQRLKSSEDLDRVFCVFDRDAHPNFEAACDRCHSLQKKVNGKVVRIEPITSTPCFEYWLILHKAETYRPYAATGRHSVGDQAVRHLGELLGSYSKGDGAVFRQVRDGIDLAIARARRGREQGLENPNTNVDLLVEYLRGLKQTA